MNLLRWWREGHRPALLVRNTIWAASNEGLRLVSTLVVFYLVTTELGPAGFGRFAGVQAFTGMLSLLSSSWIVMLLLQEVVRARRPLQEVLARSLTMTVLAGALATAAAVSLGLILFPGVSLTTLLALTAAELLGTALVSVGATAVQSQDDFPGATRLVLLHFLMRMAAVLALSTAVDLTLGRLALLYLATSTIAAVVVLRSASRRCGVQLAVALPTWGEVRSGLSYAATVGSFGVQEDSDKALLVRLASAVDAGLYAAGYRAVQLAMLPIRATVQASHYDFLVHLEGLDRQHVRRSARFTALAVLYALVAMAVLLTAAELLMQLLGGDYEEAAEVVRWLSALLLLRALGLFAFNGLMGLGRNGVRVAIASSSAAVTLATTFVLVPLYSWRGAALATMSGEVVFALLTWIALLRLDRPGVVPRREPSESLEGSLA